MRLTYLDYVQIERDLGTRSFKHFARMAWHVIEPATPLKWGWALDAECDHLQAVAEGRITRLLMNVPPGMSKSTLTSVLFPAWLWIRWKHKRIVSTAHKLDLALRDNLKCRRLIKSTWYQERWPLTLLDDQDTKTKFENDAMGFREAMAFTSLTGTRGDILIIDDPLSVDDANSAAALKAAETTFLEAVPTRLNNEQSAIIIIMQRLNEKDTSGIIKREGLPYEHLCLPMEFEPAHRCTTSIGFTDPRTVENELLFPERFTQAMVDELKKSLGSYATAGQLQQRPAPRGGGIFKDVWWPYWNAPPALRYRIIWGDTAAKDKEQNDFSVLQCWGMGYDGRIYMIDQLRGKWEAPELIVHARAFWNKHAGASGTALADVGVLREMCVEDKSSGTQLIQILKRGDKDNPPIPIRGIPRDRDKVARAHDVTPRIEAGMVVLPAAAPWLSDYLQEFSVFPNGEHDDMIDPTMDAISEMLGTYIPDFSKVW